jgi:hypothetical protein
MGWNVWRMNGNAPTIEFTLCSPGRTPVQVRMRRMSERWTANVSGPISSVGLGMTARQALTAALERLGDLAVRMLLCDLGLLEPSVAVLQVEADARFIAPQA